MANKVTNEDILRINELYYKYKVYAQVARETGFSASTVKKYVIPNWAPVVVDSIKRFSLDDLPEFSTIVFKGITNYGNLCTLVEHEKTEIEELWGEMAL